MYKFAEKLFPICRSLTGKGVVETLNLINEEMPGLLIKHIPSGTQVFDWTVPQEWEINSAYIADESGAKAVDFKDNNLHVVGYSEPVDAFMNFKELDMHLYSLEEQPEAIPYVTSYYKKRWGFCLTHKQRMEMAKKPYAKYHVKIDSKLFDGNLTYGEYFVKGQIDNEILLSTYVCHPSMANNEVSGPVVATHLAKYIASAGRRYSYRILYLPETIGSIAYLSENLEHLKKNLLAGFILTCIGDNGNYSYLASRYGDTLADRAAKHSLKYIDPCYKTYSFLERGSDERQFCAPGVDLPVCSIMRTKYGEYPEYHTSLDNMGLISEAGLRGGYEAVKHCIDILEGNKIYKNTVLCEPQLGKRGLYPTLSTKASGLEARTMMNLLAYADGSNDLLQIAEIIGEKCLTLIPIAEHLCEAGLLKIYDN